MTKYYFVTSRFGYMILLVWCNVNNSLESRSCHSEPAEFCKQLCPFDCRMCTSDDICLLCEQNLSDYYTQYDDSMCTDLCSFNAVELKYCNMVNRTDLQIQSFRLSVCLHNHNCFECLLSGECLGCHTGRYGRYCEKRCGHCHENFKSCDQLNGSCIHGCTRGWFRDTCRNSCSEKCINRSCHESSGHCIHGCLPGWYGNTCEIMCNNACLNKSCNQSSGVCVFGCRYGSYGTHCNDSDHKNITQDEYKQTNKKENNSETDKLIYVIVGTIAGVITSGLCTITVIIVRKVKKSFKRYDYLSNSLRGNAAQIYDEIVQSNAHNADSNIISGIAEGVSSIGETSNHNDIHTYDEIILHPDFGVDEDNDRVYYLHPIN